MSVTTSDRLPKGRPLTAKLGRDDWLMRSFILVIALYLVLTLAFPLYAMLSKAFSTFQFDLTQIELQVSDEQGNFSGEILSAAALNEELDAIPEDDMATSSDGRLSLVPLFPDFSFRSPVLYKVRGTTPEAVYLIGSERKVGTDWNEVDSNTFRKVVLRPVKSVGLSNFTTYFSTPSLFQSIGNSVFISVVSTIVTVSLAFAFAYALSRSCMRFKGVSLRASAWKTFWTVTIPGARYGLISAAFVVFNLVITDFGLPKVIGGQYNMLAVDIYKQVIGQQNFEMGAVVSVVLLMPAFLAFAVDRQVQKKQVALLSARSVVYEPKPSRRFDWICFAFCTLMAIFILGILGVCQFAALIKFWPYDLSLSLKNYSFDLMDGGGWDAYRNSIKLGILTAFFGTIVVFTGAYMVDKTRGFRTGRSLFQFLAMLPMAIPGMVLGLAYIFFFNNPDNPLSAIYGTMAILVIVTITHFYTVSHLTAVTALKQMDGEFESVAASLKQPFYRLFARVTVPVCMPAILDIAIYLFVNAMTTVSAVVFLYSTDTALASVAVLNMDDAGDIAPAAAMGMMIFYTNAAARILHLIVSKGILKRTQAWRTR